MLISLAVETVVLRGADYDLSSTAKFEAQLDGLNGSACTIDF